MIHFSERCQRYYTVTTTGAWRFLSTVDTFALTFTAWLAVKALFARHQHLDQVDRAPQVHQTRIAATGGFPLRRGGTANQERAARTALAFFG